ncbi:MAG TPA: transcription antitermination factor NusB [Lactobacillus sp.]|uniref:Transcription antitermination protein NusB n=1 Tax=Secundilactobacillus silagincola TaxID=1714681 RepID=A0A1Z5J1L8_9LACO|nr:transcription antitermination factor NusB [Secundilactobacillus silagincola]GAX07796.1 transcription antitermination factor NusB [Secundilactobacillus silagincola]HBF75077.1 transcription antitermination factor NusB [Lactobacillus sp.]
MTEELNRHQIRTRAFQTLFAMNANPEADRQVIYQQLLSDEDGVTADVPAYLEKLVDGVLENQDQLDAQIKKYLTTGWTLQRIAKTDLVILRIAFYELDYQADIPKRVAVNEALELAKQFSDDRSRRFINGVLSHEIEPEK